MDKIDKLQSQYKDGILTREGYVLLALQALDLAEIDLNDLADRLELPYTSIRDITIKLRKANRICIPTRKGKRSAC